MFFLVLISLAFYMIFLLSSRAMIISSIAISILYFLFEIIILKNNFIKSLIYFLPLLISFTFFQTNYNQIDNFSIQERMSTLNTEDESVNTRIRFYKHGVNHVIENPIVGLGIGNWKIKSIDYDSAKIFSYIVPYQLHNDFLEIGAELGVLGMFLYILFYFERLWHFMINIFKKRSIYHAILGLSVLVVFIDSNINFPFYRPIIIITTMFLFAYSNLKFNYYENN